MASGPPAGESDEGDLERAFDEDFASWDAAEQAADCALPSGDAVAAASSTVSEQIARHLGEGFHPASVARAQGPLSLLALPREMLLRILSLVPATGLTSCACVCTALSSVASDDTLWRRLYCVRWKNPSHGARGNTQWKRSYLDADSEEWEATRGRDGGVGGGDDAALSAIFLDMLRAKRDTVPDRRLLDSPLQADPGDIAAKVAAWLRAHGFNAAAFCNDAGGSGQLSQPPPRPDLSRQGRAALTFTRINPGEQPPVYACDQTGWVHVCGDSCTEGVVDSKSELLVCPVSGQTMDRLVHECEEEEADGVRGGGGGGAGAGDEEAGLGVFGGGFGSFFMAGYECENERALNKLLGYKAL